MSEKSGLQTKNATAKPTVSLSPRRILQRTCDCGGVLGLTGKCEQCSGKQLSGQRRATNSPTDAGDEVSQINALISTEQLPGHSFGQISVQAKLAIGRSGDKYEQEADRLAEQVMRMPNPTDRLDAVEPPTIQRLCSECEGESPTVSANLQNQIKALQGSGQPLSQSERAFFEPRFGADFSQVRIHADSRAAEMAHAVNARAFTLERDIAFGAGQYQPRSSEGQRLLAHELTHVVQQRATASPQIQRAPLTYDNTAFTLTPPSQPFTLKDAQDLVNQKITAKDLTSYSVKGATPGSTEEIFLVWIVAQVGSANRWGTEVDMIAPIGFPPNANSPAPVGKVTVTIDASGKAEAELLSAGAVTMPSSVQNRTDAEKELSKTYGITSVQDGDASWSVSELNKVIAAFGLLPAGDRTALTGVTLLRVHQIDGGKTAGEFSSSQSVNDTTVTNEATLKLADKAFGSDAQSFVGGQANPSPASYMVIVHEVGHAIATKAQRDAIQAHHQAIASSNALVQPLNEAVTARNTATDEYNQLVKDYNKLVDKYNNTKATDKDAKKEAKDQVDAKKKELDAKKKEVDTLKKDEDTKRAAVDTAKKTVESKKKLAEETRISATALAPFTTSATAGKTVAAAAHKTAKASVKGFNPQQTSESESYRTAVEAAQKAIEEYVTNAKDSANLDSLDSTTQTVLDNRNTERKNLETASAANPALTKFAPVDAAQDAWFKAERDLAHARHRTRRVQNFVEFVNSNKIKPFTKYAQENWPLKPEEFFSEAYSLWRTDPDYLKANAKLLFDWFNTGKYLK